MLDEHIFFKLQTSSFSRFVLHEDDKLLAPRYT